MIYDVIYHLYVQIYIDIQTYNIDVKGKVIYIAGAFQFHINKSLIFRLPSQIRLRLKRENVGPNLLRM